MNADQLINDAIDRLESREEIDARELLGAFLERIEKWQPVINAFITLTPDVARADAGRLERDREAGEQVGPLAGMVVAVKDDIDVGGVRCTVGSPIHAERVPVFLLSRWRPINRAWAAAGAGVRIPERS